MVGTESSPGLGSPAARKKKVQKENRDWLWELCQKGEIPIQDARQFFDQIDTEKMITMTTDGGANPNPGPAGWGVLVRQNGKFLCLWKAYPRASNNVMEISAVIAGPNYLPANMIVWLSTDSQYVQKGVTEWMPRWKRNGWKNSKKAGVANKSLWLSLDSAIERHRRVEFTWVKAHSGLIHNEISDTLATRGVKGKTYCPVSWFDTLPADTETEDDPNIPQTEVITQTEEFGADEEHLPPLGTWVRPLGLNEDEAADQAEERERSIRQFAHDQLGNSTAPTSEDEEAPQPGDVPIIKTGWAAVDGQPQDTNISDLNWGAPSEEMKGIEQEQSQVPGCSLYVRRGIEEETTDARSP
jgi:ribonuclease HI